MLNGREQNAWRKLQLQLTVEAPDLGAALCERRRRQRTRRVVMAAAGVIGVWCLAAALTAAGFNAVSTLAIVVAVAAVVAAPLVSPPRPRDELSNGRRPRRGPDPGATQ